MKIIVPKIKEELENNISLDEVKNLTKKYCQFGLKFNYWRFKDGEILLHWTSEKARVDISKFLLEDCFSNGDVNCFNTYGCTPLFYAVRSSQSNENKIKIIEYLLSKGADYNITSLYSNSTILKPLNFDMYYDSLNNIADEEQENIRQQLDIEYSSFYKNFKPIEKILLEHKNKYDFVINHSKRLNNMYKQIKIQIHNFYQRWRGHNKLSMYTFNFNNEDLPEGRFLDIYEEFLNRNWCEFIYKCSINPDKFCYKCCKYYFNDEDNIYNLNTPYANIVESTNNFDNLVDNKKKINFIKSQKYNNIYYCSKECCNNDEDFQNQL